MFYIKEIEKCCIGISFRTLLNDFIKKNHLINNNYYNALNIKYNLFKSIIILYRSIQYDFVRNWKYGLVTEELTQYHPVLPVMFFS